MSGLTPEQRLQRLEDKDAIRDLITAFARAADAICDPTLLRPLFSDDAVFDLGAYGRYEGGEAIAATMHANTSVGFQWTIHYLVSPTITLADDGDSAECFYYLWEVAKTPERADGRRSYWIGGWYTATVVRAGDAWRFHRLNLHLELLSPFAEGFGAPPAALGEA